MMNDFENILLERVRLLDQWLVDNGWKAFDPFDGLNARLLGFLTFNNHYLRIALQQSVRRFPFNLRPLLGIKGMTSSKGMGFCALGYLKLHQATGERSYIQKAIRCLSHLMNNACAGFSGYCWGNHFSYESRGGTIPLGIPTIVWTSLIANVFLDAYECLKDDKYLRVAMSSGRFVYNDIPRYRDTDGTICLGYTPVQDDTRISSGGIHNSNVLGAWLLARLSQHSKNEAYRELSKRAVDYTIKHQLPDGGWYYGEPKKYRWIDSFHTGYVLESLNGYLKTFDDTSIEKSLKKGYEYFITTFFKSDGIPKYYNYKTYPIDIQCASQGVQTLVNLREYDERSIKVAKRVTLWTLENMSDPEGYFYYRRYPLIKNKTPMLHWGQATMLSALGHLCTVI